MRLHHKNPPLTDAGADHAVEPPVDRVAGEVAGQVADQVADERYQPINKVRAMLLRIWGPADGWDNPLVGTKYDPALRAQRQHDSLEQRRERWEHRKEHWEDLRHHRHDEH